VRREPKSKVESGAEGHAQRGGDSLKVGVGAWSVVRMASSGGWEPAIIRSRRRGFGNHSLSLSAVNNPKGRASRDAARGAVR
jgi:hypothetical protein